MRIYKGRTANRFISNFSVYRITYKEVIARMHLFPCPLWGKLFWPVSWGSLRNRVFSARIFYLRSKKCHWIKWRKDFFEVVVL